ncbi:LOW QUALITY PROTEIN: spermatogenesis-associated protein 4, partial [Morphnus guianensis]
GATRNLSLDTKTAQASSLHLLTPKTFFLLHKVGVFFAKQKRNLARELLEGTIHCKPGAAEARVQDIYAMLTNRGIKKTLDREVDLTDYYYQAQLPMVTRSTASKAIKSNIRLTDIMMEPSINLNNRQKVNAIINMHMRMQEREEDPCECFCCWFLFS